MFQRIDIHAVVNAAHHAAHLMGRVLDEISAARFKRLRVHPHDAGAEPARHMRRVSAGTIMSPRLISISSARQMVTDCGAWPKPDRRRKSRCVQYANGAARAAPAPDRPAKYARSHLPRVAAEIEIRPQHVLHRENAPATLRAGYRPATSSRYSSSAGPWYQGVRALFVDHVIAVARADGNEQRSRRADSLHEPGELDADRVVDGFVESNEVHLVDRHHEMLDARAGWQ